MFVKSLLATAAVAGSVALGAAGSAHADPNIDFSLGIGFGPPAYDLPPPPPPGFGPPPPPPPGFGFGAPPPPPFFWHHHRRHWAGYGFAPPPPPPVYYGISCGAGRAIVSESGFRGVQAVDCSRPVYGYQGWKHGDLYRINVSVRGDIVGVDPIW